MPLVIIVIAIGGIFAMSKFVPRSVWNNNPVNIRISQSNDWVGEVPEAINKAHDSGFETFFHAVDGYRAAIILLRNYQRIYGLNTLQDILNKFAPESDDNPTSNYIDFVASKLVVSPAQPLNLNDDRLIKKLLLAMHHFESKGVWFGVHFVDAAIKKVNAA